MQQQEQEKQALQQQLEDCTARYDDKAEQVQQAHFGQLVSMMALERALQQMEFIRQQQQALEQKLHEQEAQCQQAESAWQKAQQVLQEAIRRRMKIEELSTEADTAQLAAAWLKDEIEQDEVVELRYR